MKCHIYKSLKRVDTYIFVPEETALDTLPDALTSSLGTLEFVMELDITPDRKLAREPAEVVLKNIDEQGFHLQMPPKDHEIDNLFLNL